MNWFLYDNGLRHERIKTLELKTSVLINLDFFIMILPFFLIINLYILIAAVITQIFNSVVELVIPIVIPTKKAKSEMETHPLIVEIAISK